MKSTQTKLALFHTIIIAFAISFFTPMASARFFHRRRAFYHPAHYYTGPWRGGYWFHGAYSGRRGWWWVVGPSWYYYPAPVYPYPTQNVTEVIEVQVPGAPPPPAAPAPAPAPAPEHSNFGTPASSAATTDTSPAPSELTSTGKAFTYYCEKTKGYFPTLKSCEEGWVATPVASPKK